MYSKNIEDVQDEIDISDLESPDAPTDAPPSVNSELVREFCETLYHNPEFLDFCQKHIPAASFTELRYKWFAEICYDHWRQFGKAPSRKAVELAMADRVKGRKDALFIQSTVGEIIDYGPNEDVDYMKAQALLLAKRVALAKAFNVLLQSESLTDLDAFYTDVDKTRELDGGTDWQVYTEDELDQLPPSEWLIEGHIPAAGLTVVTADSNTGKTFYALDMAYSIASGTAFFNAHKVRQGTVAYVYSEGHSGARRRAAAWKSYHRVESAPVSFIPFALDFSKEHTGRSLVQKVKDKAGEVPSLVVVDTLSDNFGGGDTADNQDMRHFLRTVALLRQTYGCAVLVIHHTGWQGDRERGAKSIRDAADVSVLLKATDDLVTATCLKMRDAAPWPSYALVKQPHDGCLVLRPAGAVGRAEATKAESRYVPTDAKVEALLPHIPVTVDASQGVTLPQLVDKLGQSRSELQRSLDDGLQSGTWHRAEVKNGRTKPFHYYRLS